MQTADGIAEKPARPDAAPSNVIQFPQRAAQRGLADTEADPQARLERAVLRLNRALDEQRRAVEAWRSKLVALQSSVMSLAGNLRSVDEAVSVQQEKLEHAATSSAHDGMESSR